MKSKIILFLFLACFLNIQAQDVNYARYIIDSLCSPSLHGRGYTSQGDKKAAEFLSNEFAKFKLAKFKNSYFQEYHISINSFSKEMSVAIDKIQLKAGTDFMVSLSSPSVKAEYKVFNIDSTNFKCRADMDKILKKNLSNKIVLIDKQNITDKDVLEFWKKLKNENAFHSKGIAFINDSKLGWAASDGKQVKDFIKINLLRKSLPSKFKKINIDVTADYLQDYASQNIAGYVKGKLYPDSFYVFTAHYDHLGQMGNEVYFPGANDNASGTAMVMNLARHFATDSTQPDYTMVFVLVSGEEAGLLGSTYLANHPLFPLKNIKFLINLDMMGTGSEGITVVNATKFKKEYQQLVSINKEKAYLKTVAERGESCNSDHCPFYEKGVPAIFIYAMGGEFTEYHNLDDVANKLPFTRYNEIFNLLLDFFKK